MQKQDRVRFQKIISVLSEIVGQQLSVPAQEVYFELLSPYPIEEIEAAAKRVLQTRTYSTFPKPAEFIKLLTVDMEAKAIEASKKAFDVLWTEGESHGFNGWDDPLIPFVIQRLGGWIEQANEVERICCLPESTIQEGIWRKRFETIYRTEAQTTGPREIPKMIGRVRNAEETLAAICGKNQGMLTEGDEERARALEAKR